VACTELLPDRDVLSRSYGVDRAAIDELDPGRWFVEGPGPEAEKHCPVVWQAVTVPADPSPGDAERLRHATSRRAAFGTDPVVLAPRLFSADLLAKRIEYLWLMGWYPPEGATVLVEGDASLLPMVPAVSAALGSLLASERDVTVVLAEMGSPGDADFAAALAAQLPAGSVYRLPRCAGLEDLAAAIVNCAVFAGSSPRAGLVALAYGRSSIRLDPAEPPAPGAFERAMKEDPAGSNGSALAASADAELDRIAEIARTAALARRQKEAPMPETQHPAETEDALGELQVAHEARSRRLATERMVFANHIHKAEAEIGRLKDEVARLREELARADGRTAQAEAAARAEAEARLAVEEELAGLRATRTFRYTAELRSVYGRLRKLGDDSAPTAEPPPPAETKPGL
jgi:hypothetical protein